MVHPPLEPEPWMTCLNLGCNRNARKGYINLDIEKFDGVDVVADLEHQWPFEDEKFDHVMAHDICEHIRQYWEVKEHGASRPRRVYGIFHFMNEANRVMKTGGTLDIWVPSTDGRGWAQDPTHVSYWNENTFLYFYNDNFRGNYPGAVRGTWRPLHVSTSKPDMLGVKWVRAILEKGE